MHTTACTKLESGWHRLEEQEATSNSLVASASSTAFAARLHGSINWYTLSLQQLSTAFTSWSFAFFIISLQDVVYVIAGTEADVCSCQCMWTPNYFYFLLLCSAHHLVSHNPSSSVFNVAHVPTARSVLSVGCV